MKNKITTIYYPSKGFSSMCQHLIDDGSSMVRVVVRSSWRQKLINKLLPLLEEDNDISESNYHDGIKTDGDRNSSFVYVLSMFLLPKFFFVHTYALSHMYRFSADMQNGVLYVNYNRVAR